MTSIANVVALPAPRKKKRIDMRFNPLLPESENVVSMTNRIKIKTNQKVLDDLRNKLAEMRQDGGDELGPVEGQRIENEEDFRGVLKFRIRAARIRANLTQREAAEMMEVKLPTYQKWENGNRGVMPAYQFARFCDMTGAGIFELMRHYISASELCEYNKKKGE